MAVGDLITATRYNNVQSRINTIMGTGSGDNGYGQTLVSSQKAVGAVISATDANNLRADMIRARQHQTGNDESASYPTYANTDTITEAAAANFEAQMSTIEANKFALAENQASVTAGDSSTRTTSWTASLTHGVTIDFGSANAARAFFNSGGEIRTRATISGGSGAIFTDWASMLTNMGTIKLNYTSTTATGSGTGTAIGFYDLTNVNQQIFTKTGSGVYSANDYTVFARCDVSSNASGTARYIYLTIQFNDDKGPNPNFDEAVTGTLVSIVEVYKASGSNVSVPTPTFTNTSSIA